MNTNNNQADTPQVKERLYLPPSNPAISTFPPTTSTTLTTPSPASTARPSHPNQTPPALPLVPLGVSKFNVTLFREKLTAVLASKNPNGVSNPASIFVKSANCGSIRHVFPAALSRFMPAMPKVRELVGPVAQPCAWLMRGSFL